MLVCLYALRGFTRPSYISRGGGRSPATDAALEGGMITTLVSRGQHDYIQSPPATGEMGEGRGKAGGDNDLVCQYDQSFALQG